MLGAPRTEPLRIVELGAGTGIATRLLIAEAHRYGGLERLYALDPSQGMRSALQDALFGPGGVVADLQKQLVGGADVRVGDGTFEHFGAPPDNDLVVIAQAFHWCPDFDAALRSIAAHLRPGGVLALLWNLEDRSAPWVGRVRDRYELYEQGTPQCTSLLIRSPHALARHVQDCRVQEVFPRRRVDAYQALAADDRAGRHR